MNNGEIILYQPDNSISIEVRMEAETVWLNLNQMAMLFDRDKSVISRHIRNIYSEGELKKEATVAKNATVQMESGRQVMRQIEYYNLDVIISVGYRVKSLRGTQFRQWATSILKEYLLKGYAINNRIEHLEQRVAKAEEKIDIDESVLLMLSKRKAKVPATIITRSDSKVSQLDIEKHNAQYSPVEVKVCDTIHDRFLIIDNEVYHIGASLKDLGKKLFAFSKLEMPAETLLKMTVLKDMGNGNC